jgi:hypothetical protein
VPLMGSPSATRPLRPELRTADLPVKGSGTSCLPFGPLRLVNNFEPDPLTASLPGGAAALVRWR